MESRNGVMDSHSQFLGNGNGKANASVDGVTDGGPPPV